MDKSPEYLTRNCVLCANHFEDVMFYNTKKKNLLLKQAVPTLFVTPNPLPLLTPKRSVPARKMPSPKRRKVECSTNVQADNNESESSRKTTVGIGVDELEKRNNRRRMQV